MISFPPCADGIKMSFLDSNIDVTLSSLLYGRTADIMFYDRVTAALMAASFVLVPTHMHASHM